MYIHRKITDTLKSAVKQFPVIFLTGPRQSGKSTLLKNIFNNYNIVNLEDPELREWAINQPKDFLLQNETPLIIDEAQYAPKLFSYIQLKVDEENKAGMYILSGSQSFILTDKITQTLAGRSAVLKLLPFSLNELVTADISFRNSNELIIKGFYPRLYNQVEDTDLFYKSYLNTYVERDVRQFSGVGKLVDFHRFVRLCAGRTGQLLNLSSLANEAGIAFNTCKEWLSYLVVGNIIHILEPYHKNFNKKITKSPKIFFTDTGILCNLLGIKNTETLSLHPFRGNIFENLVFCELLKSKFNKGQSADYWFWRDNHGTEVDFIAEKMNKLLVIEIKSGSNFHDNYLKNLNNFNKYSDLPLEKLLVYDGDIERKVENDIQITNWRGIEKFIE